MHYILEDNHRPILATDEQYWKWHADLPEEYKTTLGMRLDKTEIDDCLISTVFLGTIAGYDKHTPYTFETYVSGGPSDGLIRRYTNIRDAFRGHDEICDKIDSEIANTE